MSPVGKVQFSNSKCEQTSITASIRNFEDKKHASDYVTYRPVASKELINCLIAFLKEKNNDPLEKAIDLGCGSGQCTFLLKEHFDSVLGTDISPAQIFEAKKLACTMKVDNVKFECYPAHIIPLKDESAQLVTICLAAHWMDMKIVYPEIERVLKPGGVLAIIGYPPPCFYSASKEDAHKSDAINEAFSIIAMKPSATQPYWAKESIEVIKEYSNINLPMEDFQKKRGFFQRKKAKMVDILGLIRSFSPYTIFVKQNGENAGRALLENAVNEVAAILNEGREKKLTMQEIKDYEFIISFHFFMLLGRKPKPDKNRI